MFIYPNKNSEMVAESGIITPTKLNNVKNWMAYQRFFGRKVPFKAGGCDFEELELLLNHFYDIEINKTYKFNEIKLINGVIQNFFDGVEVVNL